MYEHYCKIPLGMKLRNNLANASIIRHRNVIVMFDANTIPKTGNISTYGVIMKRVGNELVIADTSCCGSSLKYVDSYYPELVAIKNSLDACRIHDDLFEDDPNVIIFNDNLGALVSAFKAMSCLYPYSVRSP